MRIETAIYRNEEGKEESISLNEMIEREDYEVAKKNLYCAYAGCLARIEYVPKGQKVAFFRTWRKDDHLEDCESFFEREKRKAALKNSAVDSAKLTDAHVRDVLKNMNKTISETPEEREQRLEKQRANYKKKKNSTVDISQPPVTLNIARPSTDNEAEYQAEGTRAPSVRRRYSPEDITEGDIGTATGLTGNVVEMELFEKRSIIALKKRAGYLKIYLEEDFFSDASLNISRMLKTLKNIMQNKNDFSIYCVGNIERRGDELCMVVSSQNHIRIDKYSIESFIFMHNNPKLL